MRLVIGIELPDLLLASNGTGKISPAVALRVQCSILFSQFGLYLMVYLIELATFLKVLLVLFLKHGQKGILFLGAVLVIFCLLYEVVIGDRHKVGKSSGLLDSIDPTGDDGLGHDFYKITFFILYLINRSF